MSRASPRKNSSRYSRESPKRPTASCGEPTGRQKELNRCDRTSRTSSHFRFPVQSSVRSSSTMPRLCFPSSRDDSPGENRSQLVAVESHAVCREVTLVIIRREENHEAITGRGFCRGSNGGGR